MNVIDLDSRLTLVIAVAAMAGLGALVKQLRRVQRVGRLLVALLAPGLIYAAALQIADEEAKPFKDLPAKWSAQHATTTTTIPK